MKKQLAVFNILLLVAGLMIILNCKKKDDPEKPAAPVFSLSSLVVQITGDTIDLNDSIAPVNVPLNPPIIAVFTIDVAPSSVDTNTITLVSMTDNSRVRLSITPASNKIVIMPTSELLNATHYQLRFIGLKSTDNQSLASLVRDFTTIEGPPVFSLSTLLAGTIDLNGANRSR
ncbi:MAG: Ig-like domain-containing protein [Bacteroidetes bacterium]|nr:Ig-like domain-containing protein [Bacteroidota bacterium]